MTQEQLAEAAEVDRRYLGRIETGAVLEPGAETVRKLARALEVPLRTLAEPLGWYEDEESEGPFETWEQVERAILNAENLDDAQKSGLILVLKPAVTAMLAEGASKYERPKKGRAAS
jgi:transcriptional regulator with XRE-family HTH domain